MTEDNSPETPETPEEPELSFSDFNLSPEVAKALEDIGYEKPMAVQSAVFHQVRAGNDIMVESRTGSGKTAAFAIPLVELVSSTERSGPELLVLVPTRELAIQVAHEFTRVSQHKQLETVATYGGDPINKQIAALKRGASIVVGTPGRVLDHLRRKTLVAQGVNKLVLDECDEMLSMGFQEEIEKIISFLPEKEERQTLLFSATIPNAIDRIARRHMRDPETISLSEGGISVDEISHQYFVVSGMARQRDLLRIITVEKPESAIIFCNTRDDTSSVARYLKRHGLDAEWISSDLSQRDRERVMGRMRDQNLRFLVATDIAARGIDISNLTHVFNYTFPESPQVYVHRTGRTGRAGKDGVAISLIGPREIGAFYFLKLTYKIQPEERDLPSAEDVALASAGQRTDEVLSQINEDPGVEYKGLAKHLIEAGEGERVLAVLLQRLLSAPAKNPEPASAEPASASQETSTEAPEADERPKRRRRSEEERPRSRRGRRGSRSERSETRDSAEAKSEKPDTEEAVTEQAEPKTAEAKDSASSSEKSEGGEKTGRKRRRRRKRSGSGERESSSSSANGADSGEFWETWADAKSEGESEREEPEAPAEKPSGVRLYVNVGKREDLDVDQVRELLGTGLEDADRERLGQIALRLNHSYVRVPEDMVETVIGNAEGKKVGERELVIEIARR